MTNYRVIEYLDNEEESTITWAFRTDSLGVIKSVICAFETENAPLVAPMKRIVIEVIPDGE